MPKIATPKTATRRPRDSERTTADILQAAALGFSTVGFAQFSMRDIASNAGIDAALIVRYFGGKHALFEAALEKALDLASLTAAGHDAFGEHVVKLLASNDTGRADPTSMMVLSAADEDAKAVTEHLLHERIIKPLAEWLGPPNARDRAALITVLCTGFVVYRRVLPLSPLSGTLTRGAEKWLAEALQNLVDGTSFSAAQRPSGARSPSKSPQKRTLAKKTDGAT